MEPRTNSPTVEHEGPASDQDGDRPLRVLVVGVSWPMETFIERLLAGLAAHGCDLTLLRLSPRASRPSTGWLQRNHVDWIDESTATARSMAAESIRHPTRAWPFVSGQVLGRFVRHEAATSLIDSGRWDVVYVPWINVLTGRTELLASATPVVTSCRGTLISITPWNPDRSAHRDALPAVFASARLVHCVSDAIVKDAAALGLDATKARVIRPAVDPENFSPRTSPAQVSPDEPLRLVGVGTLDWRKDYETALVAVRRAVDRGVDVQLDLIGDGPDRQHLAFTIDDLRLGDRVRLLGRQSADEVANRLRSADVFLHTSSSEGISNAVLEAMATALPVITADSGGMREAVRDGIDGIVVNVRDTAAIAGAIERMAADPILRSRMGSSARQRIVADFQLADQIRAFSELLHEAAGR